MDRGAEIGTIPEEAFSFDGYQVVRGEFFAHTFEPSITFCGSKLYVNMACLNKLPTVEYIQILVNQDTKKLVIRPCREDEKDSFRWCSNTALKWPLLYSRKSNMLELPKQISMEEQQCM